MTFDEFMELQIELTEDEKSNLVVIVDVSGRHAHVVDIEIDGQLFIIKIED